MSLITAMAMSISKAQPASAEPQEPVARPATYWVALRGTLLDFEKVPGRYAVALREPAALFEHMRTVLLLAAGRPIDALGTSRTSTEEDDSLRRAARFFVRTVLLRPSTDHYGVLGLQTDCTPEMVRDHYRLMIRMTHPDFAAHGESWPVDAATRINMANDVLSSPTRRAEYVATLPASNRTSTGHALRASPRPVWYSTHNSNKTNARGKPWLMSRTRLVLAGVGAVLCAGALVALGPTLENDALAVRKLPEMAGPLLLSTPELGALPNPLATSESVNAAALSYLTETSSGAKSVMPAGAPQEVGIALVMDTRMQYSPRLTPVGYTQRSPVEVAREVSTPLSVVTVQPILTKLLTHLQTGRGENLLLSVDQGWRTEPNNAAFVKQFNQLLNGRRVLHLGGINWTSSAASGQFVVDGVMQLQLLDSETQTSTLKLGLRAYFEEQDNRPVLTRLTTTDVR